MKLIKYFFVGGIAAVVDISIFFVFAKLLGHNYLIVGAISFILATLVNYVLSIRHVFESGSRFGKKTECLFVYLVSAVGLGICQLVLYLMIDTLGAEMMLSKFTATGVVFFWNYLARKQFIFKESPARSKMPGGVGATTIGRA